MTGETGERRHSFCLLMLKKSLFSFQGFFFLLAISDMVAQESVFPTLELLEFKNLKSISIGQVTFYKVPTLHKLQIL